MAKRLVAIVDDEPDIGNLFLDYLGKMKHLSIFTFTDPLVALEHIQINSNDYAIVISDLRMPNLDGFELIKRTIDLNPFVRTILMTAFEVNDKLFEDYARQQIIDAFLQKPILLPNLYEEIRMQLRIYNRMQK